MNGRKYYLAIFILQLSFLQGCEDMSMQFNNDPRGNFDALWTILDRNYCFFDYKEINWDSIYINYSERVTPEMGNDALFKLLGLMLAELKDGHVNLSASHDII